MKEEKDYFREITEIHYMMERSSKFLSLSGWAGIMAGIYALTGAFIASNFYSFNPDQITYYTTGAANIPASILKVIIPAIIVLILAICTAILLSFKKADRRGDKIWNATSKRLLTDMAVPLFAGGLLILVLLSRGLIGLIAPMTLLFYEIAIYNASKFTIAEMRFLGMFQIGLGLLSSYFIEYSLLFGAIGFGVLHIVYGVYMHLRYER